MKLIRSLNWIITYKCNLKCVHCDIGRLNSALTIQPSDVKEVLDDPLIKASYRHFKSRFNISLGGGEPFLEDNLQEIVNTIETELPGSFKCISTNGLLEERIIRFIRDNSSLDFKINLSLDGLAEVHDKIRNSNGAFDKTLQTFVRIRKINPRQKVEFKLTLTPLNYNQIINVYELAKNLNCDFSFKPAENIKSYTNMLGEIDLSFTDEQLCVIRNQALYVSDEMYKKNKFGKAKFFKDIPFYLYSKKGKTRCSVLKKDITLMPNGKVYDCIMMPSIGNIKRKKIDKIWNKKPKITEKCPSCMLMCGSYKDFSDKYYEKKIAHIETTLRCNLSCNMCTQRELRKNSYNDMNLAIFKQTIKNYTDITHVSFVGGEAFLNNNFFKMTDLLDSRTITYEITTNGTLINKDILDKLKNCAGLKKINFSLDGLEKYHDGERGGGVFKKCVAGIKLTKNLFDVNICSVMKNDNLTELRKLRQYLIPLGVKTQKIIYGMNLSDSSRKKSEVAMPILKIQGPHLNKCIKKRNEAMNLLYAVGRNTSKENMPEINFEPPAVKISKRNKLYHIESIPKEIIVCRHLHQYRFNSRGERIICEFIRNKYTKKTSDYLVNNLLPICHECCKLSPIYEEQIRHILSHYYNIEGFCIISINNIKELPVAYNVRVHQISYRIIVGEEVYLLKQFSAPIPCTAFCKIHPFLLREGFLVNHLVKSHDNKDSIKYSRQYYLLVRLVKINKKKISTLEKAKELSLFLGRYHNSMRKFTKLHKISKKNYLGKILSKRIEIDTLKFKKEIYKLGVVSPKEINLILEKYISWKDRLKYAHRDKNLCLSVIHSDFQSENIIVANEGILVSDYHDLTILPELLDISNLFQSLCGQEMLNNGQLGMNTIEKYFENIISGYNIISYKKITKNEKLLTLEIAFLQVIELCMQSINSNEKNIQLLLFYIDFMKKLILLHS